MSNKSPEAIARSLFDSLETGDFSTWEAMLAPDFTASYPGLRGSRSKAEALAFNKVFPVAFPNLEFTVTGSARSGDVVYLSISCTATHLGPLVSPQGTIPPSGRTGKITAVAVVTIRDGKIHREETYWNIPDLIEQITDMQAAA